MKGPIWEGVYASFQDVPTVGPGFSGEEWIKNSLGKIAALREAAKESGTIPTITKYRESFLPVVAGIVYNEIERVRILDFGGGIGFTFYQVARCLPKTDGFEYHIVEIEEVCEVGRDFFKEETNIFFHKDFPTAIEVDIIHMGSSLHYIEEWQEVLARLCEYAPKYFLFTDLLAGDIPTYASAQRYYDSKIPVWFFNVNEIIEVMERLDYGLIHKSAYTAIICGVEQGLPQNNFEEKYRLGNTCNLLFAEKEDV